MADTTSDRKKVKEMVQQARDLIAQSLARIRQTEAAIAKNPYAKRMFQMKDGLRKQRKMLGTLDRKMQFMGSSLFLKNADEKLFQKMLKSQLKLTKDIHQLVTRVSKEADDVQTYVERLAKQKKNGVPSKV